MDLDLFVRTLSGLYEHWGEPGCRPRSDRFARALADVRGMTTPCIMQLLNHAVGCLEAGEVYAEVGCFQGATLLGALLGHEQVHAEAIDNFSEFDPHGTNRHLLAANLRRWGVAARVAFADEDFERYLLHRRQRRGPALGVYLYDGAHDYRAQLMGLLLAVPHLGRRAQPFQHGQTASMINKYSEFTFAQALFCSA